MNLATDGAQMNTDEATAPRFSKSVFIFCVHLWLNLLAFRGPLETATRALVHDPLLILADEPTGNLDEETGAQMISLLARLTRERNRTLLIVTHNPEAASGADRVLRLSHGQLIGER